MGCTYLRLFFLRVRGTVISRVWWQILLMTIYSAIVVYIYHYYNLDEYDLFSTPKDVNIFQVLGIVTGMLLVFRTNTAYDRYWEGRKLWSDMVHNIRILTRTIWVMVPDIDAKTLVGKISLLNLLVGFAYATKHYLREEYSHDEDDLKQFVGHLPRMQTPSSNEPLENQEKLSMGPKEVVARRIQSRMSKETRAKIKDQNDNSSDSKKKNKETPQLYSMPELDRSPLVVTTNIPLEISWFVSSYIVSCKHQSLIDPPTVRVLDTAVANMVNCLTGFERIRRTPIPFAYLIHLQQITWIVLLILPFQWVHELDWFTVPAASLASFALFGILGIGREIENPFGYDYNDLNLDDFCNVLHKEMLAMIAQPIPKPETWMFSENNHPILTDPTVSAAALLKLKCSEIHSILSEGRDYKFFHPSRSSLIELRSLDSGTTNQKSEKASQAEENLQV